MLKGIDVSSWQGDIQVQNLDIDFVIAKATEGTYYVNPYCDPVIQRCINSGKLWGFYHYANDNNPIDEADYFIDNCYNYFGNGIPVLDWEEGQSVSWVNSFVERVYERTGIWCWVYSMVGYFNQGGVNYNCGRWVANYPNITRPDLDYDPGTLPDTDGLVVAWQYASDGYVPGYDGNLDVNHYYGDETSWLKYCGKAVSEPIVENPVENSVENPVEKTVLENDRFRVEITEK